MQTEIYERGDTAVFPFAEEEVPAAILLLPGLDNSGPGHWQTHWERLSHCSRVEFGDWAHPTVHDWLPALDRAIRENPRPLLLVGHSLGCLAAVWWARLYWSEAFREKVRGALLVAPPDVDALDSTPRIRDFRPLPLFPLPFPSVVAASRDDPFATIDRSRAMGNAWGSEFIDLGRCGHVNAESGIGEWPRGLRLAARLGGHDPDRLVTELGLRAALA